MSQVTINGVTRNIKWVRGEVVISEFLQHRDPGDEQQEALAPDGVEGISSLPQSGRFFGLICAPSRV